MGRFRLASELRPRGDQPKAIEGLVNGVNSGMSEQVLLGVTGSGKTFTMANVISRLDRPTLVISHNKTLAAQLFTEFRAIFPDNAVEYFVSYYDYYQPEAYLPSRDMYIGKDASINRELELYRISTTHSLMTRRDVLVVASVSCIFGAGDPGDYMDMSIRVEAGMRLRREELQRKLVELQYERNDVEFEPGNFRVRGNVVDIFPTYQPDAVRVTFEGDRVVRVVELDPLTARKRAEVGFAVFFPAKHYVMPRERIEKGVERIEEELKQRLAHFRDRGKLLEAQRLEQRTHHDVELMREVGNCPGIENYSLPLSDRRPGEPPWCLLDFFPDDYVTFIDESHVTLPQLRGMYRGDRSRKENLVEYGFRLPSAKENRPLKFDEFKDKVGTLIYVSATPNEYETERAVQTVEQVIRPTGLLDPLVEVRPTENQVDDLLGEVRKVASQGNRTLVTTLTKRMAEHLTDYLDSLDVRARYLHSEIDTLDRIEIIQDLRRGAFDVLVGVNLLREGLDLPEVALVAILDADQEGYLRTDTALIQTIGRASRNAGGRVIMYADRVSQSMERAISVTARRRKLQEEYNRRNGITPQTIQKEVRVMVEATAPVDAVEQLDGKSPEEVEVIIAQLSEEMKLAARQEEFEQAAVLRDRLRALRGGVT